MTRIPFAFDLKDGFVRSRCVLGDTRLVLAYLAAAFALGVGFAVRGWMG